MTFRTHIAFATTVALPPLIYLHSIHAITAQEFISLIVTISIGSLLPDLDHTQSYISKKVPLISQIIAFFTSHRGFTHSISGIIAATVTFTAIALFFSLPLVWVVGFMVGYVLHILGDAMTVSGVKVCCGYKIYLVPKALRFRVGSDKEKIYFAIFSALISLETLFAVSTLSEKFIPLLYASLNLFTK